MGRDTLGMAKNINLIVGTLLVVMAVYNMMAIFNAAFDPPSYILDIYSG